jgi:FAS-associated factor 2
MTVITRHSGSPNSITSASALTGHITNTVLPRVAPVLNRKRAEQQARLQERRLREEQDRAYEESQRKDRERILKRREEERREREEEERLRQEAEEREILLASAAAERYRQAREKMAWRRYARRMLVPTENPASKTAVRIGFRIPSGKLVVRKFEPTDSVTSLYAFVASQFIPETDRPEDDPTEPPTDEDFGSDLEDHDWDWEFRLASTFPKSIVAWKQGERVNLGDVPALKGGASLVVEMLRPIETGESTEEEDDDGDETASEDSE